VRHDLFCVFAEEFVALRGCWRAPVLSSFLACHESFTMQKKVPCTFDKVIVLGGQQIARSGGIAENAAHTLVLATVRRRYGWDVGYFGRGFRMARLLREE
jgi:hypothetical protein